jgi:hypothetical protein
MAGNLKHGSLRQNGTSKRIQKKQTGNSKRDSRYDRIVVAQIVFAGQE